MSRHKKAIEEELEEDKIEEEKREEDPLAPKEEPKEKHKEEKKKEILYGRMGTANHSIRISYISKRMVNGRLLNDVHLEDGTTYLLTDEDFQVQWIKPPQELS